MEYDVIVPKFDEDGTIATISKWHKAQGDSVTQGEVIAEVDSDTATCEIIAPASGTLTMIFIPEGKKTTLGAQIASIVSSNNIMSDYINASHQQNASTTISTEELSNAEQVFNSNEFIEQQELVYDEKLEKDMDRAKEAKMEIDAEVAFKGTVEGKPPEQKLNQSIEELKKETGKTVHEICDELDNNINFHVHINNTNDIETANQLSKVIIKEKPATNPDSWNKVTKITTPNESISPIGTIEKSISNRRKIAATVISTVINEIDMSDIIAASKDFGEVFFEKYGLQLGYTPFIIKATVEALKEFPMFNAYILDDEKIIYKNNYDISIITHGLDSAPSPVIRGADTKTLKELQEAVTTLSQRAASGELTLEESSGATFTLINAGIYGSLLGSDIVAYPQIAALTMHKVSNRAVVIENNIQIKPMMYISMSFDHRIANSRSASLFLEKIRKLSENLSWIALRI